MVKMSLGQILKGLGAGTIPNLANTLAMVVQAVITEIEDLRQGHANTAASQRAAVNDLEDRTSVNIADSVELLTAKMETVARELNSRMIALDSKVLELLEANVTTTVEDIGQAEDRVTERLNGLEATVRTHVERLETEIAAVVAQIPKAARLNGYGQPN
jgi:uncharacterized phage infection (PIP) family protein YhgE